MLQIQFTVIPAYKCKEKDIIKSLDIYCQSVDEGSLTDTNQIKDYILNPKRHENENRSMFFYLLYGADNTVEGFAELGYLPKNQVLVLDYICTSKRSNVQFYSFYNLILQETEDTLKKQSKFIRYVLTELSLKQRDGKLIDRDSNYFRHLLSNENYHLLNLPYYQPPLSDNEEQQEFNLAIKLLSVDSDSLPGLSQEKYLSIVYELYYSHYLAWYQNYMPKETIEKVFDTLYKRIQSEFPVELQFKPFEMVQCYLFEDGQCPKLSVDNYTIPRIKKRKQKKFFITMFWFFFSVLTLIFCIFPPFSKYVLVACSFLTIVPGIISIFSLKTTFFN